MHHLAPDTDLDALSDAELAALEDALLLEQELDWRREALFSGGRLVILGVGVLLGIAVFSLLARVPALVHGPLSILTVVVCLAASAALAFGLWRTIGPKGRQACRLVLHYWPVTLYLIALTFVDPS